MFFLFFLISTLVCPVKVCFQIPFGRVLYGVEPTPLICKANLTNGFFMVQVFVGCIPNKLQYSFILGSNHWKVSLYFYICDEFILGRIAYYHRVVLLESSFVGVFMLFVRTYFTRAWFLPVSMFFSKFINEGGVSLALFRFFCIIYKN